MPGPDYRRIYLSDDAQTWACCQFCQQPLGQRALAHNRLMGLYCSAHCVDHALAARPDLHVPDHYRAGVPSPEPAPGGAPRRPGRPRKAAEE